jgi:hypothetical protein
MLYGIEFHHGMFLGNGDVALHEVNENCWFTESYDHAIWYASYKQSRNSMIKGICVYGIDDYGLPAYLVQ